ncbi:MAG: hypothetical protein H0V17_04475, partial [Deltaproteobacteria bacterium]|nr:hypothetical protein [Deltaproteobacteria bacterium]
MSEPEDTTDLPAQPVRPIVAVVLGVCAALALGFAALSSEWLYAGSTQLQLNEDSGMTQTIGPVHEMSIGLRSVSRCIVRDRARTCEEMSGRDLLDGWDRELLSARYLAEEPVETEARAVLGDARFNELVKQRTIMKTDAGDPMTALGTAQRDLVVAKHVYASSSSWPTFGLITWIAVLLASVSLLVAVGIVLAGKRVRLPVMPTTT